jgi:hypothetical protein
MVTKGVAGSTNCSMGRMTVVVWWYWPATTPAPDARSAPTTPARSATVHRRRSMSRGDSPVNVRVAVRVPVARPLSLPLALEVSLADMLEETLDETFDEVPALDNSEG